MHLPQVTEVHLWFTRLDQASLQEQAVQLLNAEEIKRAAKFKFSLHRERFMVARASLRSILSLYLNLAPQALALLQTENGKPYLENSPLVFNLSHSHDLAVYAFTQQTAIGIDLEKIRASYSDNIAKRFFSPEEYEQFSQLTAEQKLKDFYRIWTGKEAVIKALGERLSFSLASFTIATQPNPQTILLKTAPQESWFLEHLDLFPEFQLSLVTNRPISKFSYWEWTGQGEKMWREPELRSAP